MRRDMAKGQPGPNDHGLDHTHTWARTYWGGALFCLVADVRIRRTTQNKKGLREALRAIRDAGGIIDHTWPLDQALRIGDAATGVTVLETLYAQMKDAPVAIDLDGLWNDLGVIAAVKSLSFNDAAPLAAIRRSIVEKAL
jgi:predicted metalloprotease with PDZ domain